MRIINWLGRLLPARCVFCRHYPAANGVCDGCRQDLPRLGDSCAHCAEPLVDAPQPGLHCARCQQRPPPWARCRAALPYAWPVDVALHRLKYSRQLFFAEAFGALLAQRVEREFTEVDALCAVPLHRWRHLLRGFNQAEELCRPIKRRTGLPLMKNVTRVRSTAPQSGLGRQARRRNLQGAFALRGSCLFQHPLIIDDVMTTGETCRHVAELLLDHGALKVSVLTVARARVQAGAVVNV